MCGLLDTYLQDQSFPILRLSKLDVDTVTVCSSVLCFVYPQQGTVAPQSGFTDTNVGYPATAPASTQQSPGMPYKSATVEHQLAYQQRGTAQHHQQPQYQYGGQTTTTGYTQVGIVQNRHDCLLCVEVWNLHIQRFVCFIICKGLKREF